MSDDVLLYFADKFLDFQLAIIVDDNRTFHRQVA